MRYADKTLAAIPLRRYLPGRCCSDPVRRRCDTDAPFRMVKEKPARKLTEECRSIWFSYCDLLAAAVRYYLIFKSEDNFISELVTKLDTSCSAIKFPTWEPFCSAFTSRQLVGKFRNIVTNNLVPEERVGVVYIISNLPPKLVPVVLQRGTASLVLKMGMEKVGAVFYYVFRRRYNISLSPRKAISTPGLFLRK